MKEKLIVLIPFSPWPTNYGGKVGGLSNLRNLSHSFDLIIVGLLEKDDIIDDNEIRKFCSEYKFVKRNKKSVFNFCPFSSYPIVSRTSKELKSYITDCVKKYKIKYIYLDSLFMIGNVKHLKNKCSIIINEPNLEYRLLKEIGQSKKGITKTIYYWQSMLMKKIELKTFSKFNLKGMCFVSADELNWYANATEVSKEKLFYLPVSYKNASDITSKIESDILIIGNYKYAPNIHGLNWFLDNVADKLASIAPAIKISVIGRGLNEEFIEKIKHHENVFGIGEVESVAKYYNGTKCVVIPLFHGAGVKIKLLEAVSYNKPIVCTTKSIEGTRFDNKCLCIANTPDEFVENILNVINNKIDVNKKIQNAKNIFEHDYNEEIISKELYKFITR